MKKQLLILVIVAILVTVGLSGCSSSPKNKFIGTWVVEENERNYTFYSNGSVNEIWTQDGNDIIIPNSIWYDYSIAENKIIINNVSYEFTFTNNNQILILYNNLNGGNYIFERQ
jgi:hypothetical protein